jgi:hypothetical protein
MIIAINKILAMVDLEYPSVFGSGNAISGFRRGASVVGFSSLRVTAFSENNE